MRLLVDYRPALRARTGVGEWIHNLVRTIIRLPQAPGSPAPPAVSLFVSSWKDRPTVESRTDLAGATFIDRRIPVRLLTWAWNRLSWPPVEWLTGQRFDVAFSPSPLLLPSRSRLRVVTVHDLDFLEHPERARREMRRDFPALAASHVRRADLVVTISQFTAAEAVNRLGISRDRIVVCRPGVPDWILARSGPPVPRSATGGYILFVGTIEPRKNVAGLVRAYERLANRLPDAPHLVLAGGVPPGAGSWLAEVLARPVGSRIEARGYVRPEDRSAVYAGASMLVLPSYMEGFGLPVLEAMAMGVPVIVSSRGALPEVAGDAGIVVDPDDTEALADAMHRVLSQPETAATMRRLGLEQAARFSWSEAARTLVERLSAALGQSEREFRGTGRP